MRKFGGMPGREKWTNNSTDRLRHETFNKRLLGYVITLNSGQMDVSKKAELLNQCVFFLELAMGDQDESAVDL